MTARILTDQAALAEGVVLLVAADPRLEPVLAKTGPLALRRREPGFAGLCSIVVSQQLSTASASAIWKRLSAAFDPFEPADIRRARATRLTRLGLSAAKIRTLKALGKSIAEGTLDLDALATMPADDAHRALTALHGIGPWTADIYLLFCLGHADAWPAGDLALQESARLAFGRETRPSTKEMIAIAEAWRPWRGVAAHMLWAYYRVLKERDPVPIQPNNGGDDGR
jgi:DNA-3-methyladenine glycosylase II